MTWPLDSPPNCSNRRCLRPSDLTIDGEPYCISCGDELTERFIAVSLNPDLREQLPPLWES